MGPFQKALNAELQTLPRKMLATQIEKKLRAAGVITQIGLADKIAEHFLSGANEPFVWDDNQPNRNISLAFNDDDLRELNESIKTFSSEKLRKIFTEISSDAATRVARTLKTQWSERSLYEEAIETAFKTRLYIRWKKSFDLLHMLLIVARELGDHQTKRHKHSKSKTHNYLRYALSRLHARSCQVTAEIFALMQAGFADGAMARWRTLHEITVIALLLNDHGNELAERYLSHDVIDASNASRAYIKIFTAHGRKRDIANTDKIYKAAIKKYGSDFKQPNGWAASIIKRKPIKFSDLEIAAGRANKRLYYKLASFNIHNSPHSFATSLGTLNDRKLVLAGASNAGMEEPGRHAAFDLVTITSMLFGPKWTLDDLIYLQVLYRLRDEAEKQFMQTARKMRAEDKAKKKKARVSK